MATCFLCRYYKYGRSRALRSALSTAKIWDLGVVDGSYIGTASPLMCGRKAWRNCSRRPLTASTPVALLWPDHQRNVSQPGYAHPLTSITGASCTTTRRQQEGSGQQLGRQRGKERIGKNEVSSRNPFRAASRWGTSRKQAYRAEFFAILTGTHHLQSRPCSEWNFTTLTNSQAVMVRI